MTYSLYDKNGRGDSGQMSKCYMPDDTTNVRPTVGGRMCVGSPYARTFGGQDYWLTTPITEIVSEAPNKVVFRTRTGSEYCWSEF